MGQTIEINGSRQIGEVLVIDTNRSLAGQDGEAYTPGYTTTSDTFPARLAERLFEADADIDRVHVMSNAVSISRAGEWTESARETVEQVVAHFFRFYPD
ncbi:MAG TPA: hypothetical protein VLB85_12000 [Acidimicrobiia bacterium]|nr:hypothetical protein [Acidimicrobiia bacterium]